MSRNPDPALVARAMASAQQGGITEAYKLLTAGVEAGDALAAAALAEWRLTGQLIRRDLSAARELYGKAAALGHREAGPAHIAMLANGAGGTGRRWGEALDRLGRLARREGMARRQAELIAAMQIDANGDPLTLPAPEMLSERPHIALYRSFLTMAECRYLGDRALPLLAPSIVVDPRSGQQVRDPVRSALSAAFPFVLEDPAIHALNRRIMAATGTLYAQGEPVQVLSYQAGQEYRLHSDCLPPGSNQRAQTFLAALTEGFAGGETSFPRIGLTLRLAAGDALHFVNADSQGQPEPLAWHAGLPVTGGRKLLLSKWICQAPLDLSGPPGRPF